MEILSYIFQGIFTAILWLWWILVPVLGLAAWQNFRKARWAEAQEHVLLTIKIPRSNDKDPTAAEMMFAALHGILRPKKDKIRNGSMQEYLSFEMVAKTDAIHFYVGVPIPLRDYVESQIYAQYPTAEIKESEDYTKDIDIDDDGINDAISCVELRLKRDEIIPLKTFSNFKVDPLAGITSALAKLDGDKEQVWIQILTRPIPDDWQKKGIRYIQAKKTGKNTFQSFTTGDNFLQYALYVPFKFIGELFKAIAFPEGESKSDSPKLAPDVESALSAIEEKVTKLGFQVKIRIISIAKTKMVADQRLQAAIGAFKQFNTINLNSITARKSKSDNSFLNDFRTRAFYDRGFILNIEELASLYHLPHTSVETPNINWTSSKTGEPPINLPNALNTDPQDLTLFAETNFRHHKVQFGIKTDDRRRHAYIIGKSGMGKSKLLEKMMEEDIKKGNGFAVIDPNGDLIVDTLKKIPKERMEDVILLDPADQAFPIGFNPLEVEDETLKHFVAQGFVGILAKLFGHSWGPRLEYILNYTILALLDYPDSTVLGIVRMLTDKGFRKRVIKEIKDPVVKKFWTTEFASYNEKFATEAVAPILNKVGQFTASSMIRNIIGQPVSSFNIREAMDTKKILLINLSTGRVGEVNSSLLGGMIITKIQLAAMSRASLNPEDRVDFMLYVDEFQHFATESFATILSEARKYKLSLIVANQYIAQMEETVKDAVFGNVGTMITFKVGAVDAQALEKELNPPFEVTDIINLDRQQIYLKMTVDGKTSTPFSAKTLPISDNDEGNTEAIIDLCRQKYSKPRKEVEDAINKWSNIDMENEAPEKELSSNNLETNQAPKEAKQEAPSTGGFAAPIVKKMDPNDTQASEKKDSGGFTPPIVKKNNTLTERNNEPTKETEQERNSSSKNRKRKKKSQRGLGNVDSDKLKEALKAASTSTPDREDTPKKEIKTAEKGAEEVKPINKDEVKKIIETALKPKEEKRVIANENKSQSETHKEAPLNLNNEVKRKEIALKRPETTTLEPIRGSKEIKPITATTHTHRKEEREEKVVTPHNFKGIKQINPNEKIILKKEIEETKELKQGEEIIFKKEEAEDK